MTLDQVPMHVPDDVFERQWPPRVADIDRYGRPLVTNKAGTGLQLWPADLHLIGKEIVRFHAIFWPAFLMAAEATTARYARADRLDGELADTGPG